MTPPGVPHGAAGELPSGQRVTGRQDRLHGVAAVDTTARRATTRIPLHGPAGATTGSGSARCVVGTR
eukprot:12672347-Alexandrium_andersonii.AAC.1